MADDFWQSNYKSMRVDQLKAEIMRLEESWGVERQLRLRYLREELRLRSGEMQDVR